MTSNLIILAGGASSRMKSSLAVEGLSAEEIKRANVSSKALLQFGKRQRPMLDYLLYHAEKAGYTKIFLVVGENHEAFMSYYGNRTQGNSFRTMTLSYATQYLPKNRSKPWGTADAVAQTLEQYPQLQQELFVVCNCDNLYSVAALKALATTPANNALIAYDRDGLLYPMERISRFALTLLDEENKLIDIIEKPTLHTAEKYRDAHGKFRVSMNLFKFNGSELYRYFKECPPHPIRNEKELPTAILKYCDDHPSQFKGIPMCEHVPDLTSKEDILTIKKYIETHFDD